MTIRISFKYTSLILLILAFLNIRGFSQYSPRIEQYELSNGFKVFLCEDHTRQKVFGTVICKAGSKNDPTDATGMAHYQEHMLFKGTTDLGTTDWISEKPHIDSIFNLYDLLGKTEKPEKRKEIQHLINEESLVASKYAIPNEFPNLVKRMGGTDMNAFTRADITLFYNTFPPNQIIRWLDLYSHRFINPVFRSFQAELEVVYEEKNMRLDNFFSNIYEKFLFNFFKVHPYGQHTTLGTIEDLKNPSLTKMLKFFNDYYVANNMGLVLVGDFNSDSIKQEIAKKFAILKPGIIPEKKTYDEQPFHGREFVEGNYSPINLGIIGFRTVPKGHPDEICLDVIENLLSNQNHTGLLDKLVLENKMLTAQIVKLPFNDLNGTVIAMAPKMRNQDLEETEKLVLGELEKIKKGEFSDRLLNSIKLYKYLEFELSLENLDDKALLIANAFGQNKDISDVFNYPAKIKSISREDIIKTANTYFGNNYLVFFSHIGSTEKEKIEKPDFKPLISNTNANSTYAKYFETIPSESVIPKYIDFSKDESIDSIDKNTSLHYVINPVNDIFEMILQFGIGTAKLKTLQYGAALLNYSGVDGLNLSQFKDSLSSIGCSYKVSCDRSYFYVELQGPDQFLEQSIGLIQKLLTEPRIEKEKLNVIYEYANANRRIEKSEPENVGDALFEYLKYNKNSDYLNRLSMQKIKKLNVDSLINECKKATGFELQIQYSGSASVLEVSSVFKKYFIVPHKRIKSESPCIRQIKEYTQNYILLTDMKNARQSKIFFFCNGTLYNKSIDPYANAFNLYFGGDFSGLVLQQIREYRSLAYTAGAEYMLSPLKDRQTWFEGYVGTQSDKTFMAIDAFMNLVRSMPQKPENISMTKEYLLQSAITSTPNFRQTSKSIEEWKLRGYIQDPLREKIPVYGNLTFEDILKFYNTNVLQKPFVIAIAGDTKKIDQKQLKKFGKIIRVKEKKLFTD